MSSNNQIKYSEYFKNRFANHDTAIKKIIEEHDKPPSRRKKRNYQDAFAKLPPYTRFSDELI